MQRVGMTLVSEHTRILKPMKTVIYDTVEI